MSESRLCSYFVLSGYQDVELQESERTVQFSVEDTETIMAIQVSQRVVQDRVAWTRSTDDVYNVLDGIQNVA